MIKAGKIPVVKLGNRELIPTNWVEENFQKPAAEWKWSGALNRKIRLTRQRLGAFLPISQPTFKDTALTVDSTQKSQFVHAISLSEEMIGEYWPRSAQQLVRWVFATQVKSTSRSSQAALILHLYPVRLRMCTKANWLDCYCPKGAPTLDVFKEATGIRCSTKRTYRFLPKMKSNCNGEPEPKDGKQYSFKS